MRILSIMKNDGRGVMLNPKLIESVEPHDVPGTTYIRMASGDLHLTHLPAADVVVAWQEALLGDLP